MPIYEYECQNCSNKFELFRRIDDRDIAPKCPKCGAENAQRVIGGFTLSHYRGIYSKPAGDYSFKDRKTYYPKYKPKSSK